MVFRTEVVALAQQVVGTTGALAWRQGRVQVVLQVADAEAWAAADEQLLWQVLVDLLHGAVRRTLPGGIVMVGVESQADALVVRVRDSGELARPDELARARRWAERLGGAVTVESAESEGNCFSIVLPCEPLSGSG